jgi:hypothetical protein
LFYRITDSCSVGPDDFPGLAIACPLTVIFGTQAFYPRLRFFLRVSLFASIFSVRVDFLCSRRSHVSRPLGWHFDRLRFNG